MKSLAVSLVYRYLPLMFAMLATSCIPPEELHGGAAAKPEPSDWVFMGGGAALDGGLQLAKVPAGARVLAVAASVIILRYPRWGGRYEGVGLTIPFGAFVPEWTHMLVHGLKHPSHPSCTISRGPDTAVTQPVAARELRGQLWGDECLTWEEVRRLRHAY